MSSQIFQKLSQLYNSKSFPWILICIGIALRLIRYLDNPPLMFDEANTALDIITRHFWELLKSSPDYDQTYPFSFLMLNKLAIGALNNSEYAFRLMPLIWGIISVILFYYVAKHYIGPHAMPAALLFFAILDPLVYYSSLIKPYPGDVAVTLIVFALIIYFRSKKTNAIRTFLFALGGAAVAWFSNASVFVLAGTGSGLTISCLRNKEWSRLKSLLIIFLFWAVSFTAYYDLYLKNTTTNIGLGVEEMLKKEHAFMPFPPKSLTDIKWYFDTFFETLNFHDIDEFGWRLTLPGIVALAFLVGCISMFSRNRENFFIIIGPIIVTVLASAMHRYPFKGRLIFFLAPLLILFIGEGIRQLWEKIGNNSSAIRIFFIVLLFLYPLSWAAYHSKNPISRSEIKPVLSYIRDHWHYGDIIYVHYYAQYEFDYYSKYHPEPFNFKESEYLIGIAPRGWYNRWKKQEVPMYYNSDKKIIQTRNDILKLYSDDLNRLKGRKRVWVLFSGQTSQGSIKEEDFFLFHLESIGKKIDFFGRPGITTVYLFDLSG